MNFAERCGVDDALLTLLLQLLLRSDDDPIASVRSRTREVNTRSDLPPGEQGTGQGDRKWKLWGECGRVFSRARRKDTTSTPAEAQGVNG